MLLPFSTVVSRTNAVECMPRLPVVVIVLAALTPNSQAVEPVNVKAQAVSAPDTVACYCYQSGGWSIQQTDNFRICTIDRNLKLENLPRLCESLRLDIQATWLSEDCTLWQPRCDVVVHATSSDYRRALGNSVGNSVGCATMKFDQGRIVSRRIDIRVDADHWQLDALPHELTHVVLADRFGARRLPPWLDEGIGVLSESDRKRRFRADAFADALNRGTIYSIHELLHLRQFPRPEYRDAFYAQSGALVRRLMDHGGPDEFARFADRVVTVGTQAALSETYNLDTPADVSAIVDVSEVAAIVTCGGTLDTKSNLIVRRDD
tara:strand:+ start:18442 stop:19401 length:960 start_codon:yes stop_codon:yes gene_type:complete